MEPFGHAWRAAWPLEPGLTYLNHGTVGVTPLRVLDGATRHPRRNRANPSRFLLRELCEIVVGQPQPRRPRLRQAADVVGEFVGARGDDLVFVDNTTTGANAVLRSFPLEARRRDCRVGLWLRRCDARRDATPPASVARPSAPRRCPIQSNLARRSSTPSPPPRPKNTKLAVVDHVTSESALVLPLAAIAERFRARGVAVLADGAHAPGAIPLDIPALGVDWYVGNLHKWLWVPRSSGILWASPDAAGVASTGGRLVGLERGFNAEFDMPGTRDPSPHLSAPAAIAFMHELGVDAVRQLQPRAGVEWRTVPVTDVANEFVTPEALIGTMATVMMPDSLGSSADDAARVRDALLFDHGIEVQVHAFRGRLYTRICGQIYNEMSDVHRLAEAAVALADY